MKVPKSFKGVTVDQFQRILPIYNKIEKESDVLEQATLWCKIISILTDKKPHEIEALPIDELKSIIKSLDWMGGKVDYPRRKYLFIKGRLYKAKTEAKQFSTAQYIEIKTFLGQGNAINEMHKILASIYSPLTWRGFRHSGNDHAKRADIFKGVSVARVYATVFFYSIQYKNSINRMREYGLKVTNQMNKEAEQLLMLTLKETLESIGDGTQQLMK